MHTNDYKNRYSSSFWFRSDSTVLRFNERRISEAANEKEDVVYRNRVSRLDAWKALVKQAQTQLQLPVAEVETIARLGLTLIFLVVDVCKLLGTSLYIS